MQNKRIRVKKYGLAKTTWANLSLEKTDLGVDQDQQYFLQLYRKDEGDYFSRNFVYILRTTTTLHICLHMVSFIDFYFHFLVNFQTSSPHMFSIFTKPVRDINREPGLPVGCHVDYCNGDRM